MGPVSIRTGSLPTTAVATTRARGRRPRRAATSGEVTVTAAAPSTMPEELPAWMTPSSRKLGLSPESTSTVVPGRMCSSSPKRHRLAVRTGHRHRDDLPAEPSRLARRSRLGLRGSAELVELAAGQLPLAGDELGGEALGHQVREAGRQPRRGRAVTAGEVRAHRDAGHRLHSAGQPELDLPGHHRLGHVDHRAEPAATEPVHRLARDGDGEAGGESGGAGDVEGLLSHLGHAAEDDVLHPLGGDAGPGQRRLQHVGRQVHRVDSGQASSRFPRGCALHRR